MHDVDEEPEVGPMNQKEGKREPVGNDNSGDAADDQVGFHRHKLVRTVP